MSIQVPNLHVDPRNPEVRTVTSAVERRLAAVVSADGKGYSRLMSEDEIGTVRTLTAYRSIMRDTITELHGRVVDTPGDNVLAEFGSVVDAVSYAVEIQRQLGERNAELPERRRLEFRLGVNLGDVLVDGERIYGDTINVAARLERLADAGGICISGVAYDHIADKLDLKWDSLGCHRRHRDPDEAPRLCRASLERRRRPPWRKPHRWRLRRLRRGRTRDAARRNHRRGLEQRDRYRRRQLAGPPHGD